VSKAGDCDDSCDLRKGLLDCVDEILSVRDCLGVNLAEVFFVTRTWSGDRPGDGSFSDEEAQMLPSPSIADYAHNIRATESSSVKAGDLILGNISRNRYPTEDLLLTTTAEKHVERFIKVGEHYYNTIHVKEELLTWEMHVRKIIQDKTEER
jgi:hypothetical protein